MTKRLIVKPNEMGIGYDVGWSVWSPLDEKWCERWWGNTKDAETFASMTEDARRQGYEFELSREAKELITEATRTAAELEKEGENG